MGRALRVGLMAKSPKCPGEPGIPKGEENGNHTKDGEGVGLRSTLRVPFSSGHAEQLVVVPWGGWTFRMDDPCCHRLLGVSKVLPPLPHVWLGVLSSHSVLIPTQILGHLRVPCPMAPCGCPSKGHISRGALDHFPPPAGARRFGLGSLSNQLGLDISWKSMDIAFKGLAVHQVSASICSSPLGEKICPVPVVIDSL